MHLLPHWSPFNKLMASPDIQSSYHVFAHQKSDLLIQLLKERTEYKSVAIFVRTREAVHSLNTELRNAGFDVDSVHPSKKESQRELALSDFSKGNLHVIITTDAYARSVDIKGASQIINFELPELFEDYTGRLEALTSGQSEKPQLITFVTPQDEDELQGLQKRLGGEGFELPQKTLESFNYDAKDLVVKARRNAANPNRTKTRGDQSKPLQNKKQKLKRGKKR